MIEATLLCYSLVAFRETRSEPIAAQIAVIKVLENRATLNKTSACKELKKDNQFSWVEQFGITKPTLTNDLEKQAWQQAKNVAKSAKNIIVKGITPQHVYFNTLAIGKRFKTKTKIRSHRKTYFLLIEVIFMATSQFQFKPAQRQKAKARIGISSPSGAGKTMGALLIAKGLGGRIAVIDSEQNSASLNVGKPWCPKFDVTNLEPPYSPERYIEAITAAENAGYDIIIIDSTTHDMEWNWRVFRN